MSFGERFLDYPDLFPGRPSGEAWGTLELGLNFAGSPVLVTGLTEAQAQAIEGRLASVVGDLPSGAGRPTRLQLFRAPESDFVGGDFPGFELDFRYGEQAVCVAGSYLMARFDWRPELAAALWTPSERGFTFTSPFENLCRALVAHRLTEEGGALIHSSAAADDDSARLFVGSSGAGKTTVWRLLQEEGVTVLCDDLNALFAENGDLFVTSTPFSTVAAPRRPMERRRLSEILFLQQGDSFRRRPISPAEAMGRLFGNSPFVNRNPHREDRLFDTLSRICHEAPAAVLTFPKRPGLWKWLESGN